MIKCSELTPLTGQFLDKLISQSTVLSAFVNIINGGVDVATAFAALPFGHLLFTGSTEVGKQVMLAASHNLTPVTLELGGKSPAIISPGVNIKYLDRLFMGKLFNAGQTCVAPDYLLVPNCFLHRIEALAARFLDLHYPELMDNDHYTSLISEHHKDRLVSILDDAKAKGARIVQFGELKENARKFPFYLVFDVTPSMRVMQEELFGPLLPVLVYNSFSDVIDLIHSKPKPLALYYFGDNKEEIKLLQFNTLSGALTINDTVMQLAVDSLPFGGVGQSGLGQYHGQEGFDTFSKNKTGLYARKVITDYLVLPPLW